MKHSEVGEARDGIMEKDQQVSALRHSHNVDLRHRNDVVFNGASVSASGTVRKIREEIELWRRARILRSELFRTAALEPARWHEGE